MRRFKMKIKKEYWIIIIVLIVILGVLFYSNSDKKIIEESEKVCFENNCFKVEIADTQEEREKGLMFKKSMLDNEGMLFVFNESKIYPFWMKNTLISLDIIWINENKEVVFIANNAQPCEEDPCPLYNPGKEALYVFEINEGLSEKIGLEVGKKLDF